MVDTKVKKAGWFYNVSVYFSTLVRIILNILLAVTLLALIIGVYKAGDDLLHNIHEPLEELLQTMLLNIVFIFALVEVSIIILGYLQHGRVHVRYIVDTVLIIMLNEVVSSWFTHPESFERYASLTLIIAVLGALRISVTRFAPEDPPTGSPRT